MLTNKNIPNRNLQTISLWILVTLDGDVEGVLELKL